MKSKLSWAITTTVLVTCVLSYKALAAPLDSGEEQVKDAVRKAEAAASLAAEHSDKRDHKGNEKTTEDKISKLAAEIEDNSSLKEGRAVKKVNLLMHHISHHHSDDEDDDSSHNTMRVKEHRVHRKPGLSHLMGMNELGDNNPASYKEDTKLEDRLALEAEEEKKYEDGYGGNQWDDGPTGGSKGGSWSTNIQRQDAAEKQSIQAQVASESAHELNEIQQAVAAESQSSRGSATMGEQGASVVQLSHNDAQGARFREEDSGPRPIEAGASFEAPRVKSFESSNHMNSGPTVFDGLQSSSLPYRETDLSSILRQSTKLSPSELQGPPKQFSSENLGGLSNFGSHGLSRFSQGSQESLPIEMSNSFAGSESNQLGGASMQEVEPSQKEAFTAGALQGAQMEGGSMHGAGPIEIGGNNMQSIGSMSTTGFAGQQQQQQQPLVAGLQGLMGGGGMQTLGAAGGNTMGAMQPFANMGANMGTNMGANMGANMGGIQTFGGGAGGMSFKKSAIERPDNQQEIQNSESRKISTREDK